MQNAKINAPEMLTFGAGRDIVARMSSWNGFQSSNPLADGHKLLASLSCTEISRSKPLFLVARTLF